MSDPRSLTEQQFPCQHHNHRKKKTKQKHKHR